MPTYVLVPRTCGFITRVEQERMQSNCPVRLSLRGNHAFPEPKANSFSNDLPDMFPACAASLELLAEDADSILSILLGFKVQGFHSMEL